MTNNPLSDLENMEQQIVSRAKPCFYIRRSKHDNPSMIYATIYISGRKYHVGIGLKVRPSQWNKSKQEAKTHPSYSYNDNLNNSIANAKISSLKLGFANSYWYLCSVNKCLEMLTKYKHNKTTIEMTNAMKSAIEVTQLMRNVARANVQGRSYKTECTKIERFKKFLHTKRISNKFESMNYETINQFKDWLHSPRVKISWNTAEQTLRAIKRYLKRLGDNPANNYDYSTQHIDGITSPKDTRSVKEKKNNYVALTHEHINTLKELNLSDDDMRICRDLFLMQCYSGVRVSDLPQLLNPDNFRDIDGEPYSIFIPKKTEHSSSKEANIPLSHYYPHLLELYKKYKGQTFDFLPSDDNPQGDQSYNRNIRTLGQLCGWNEEISISQTKGGKKVIEKMPLYKMLTSHCGRHTFITNVSREFRLRLEDICHITGHANSNIIESTYLNLSHCDGANILNQIFKTEEKKMVDKPHDNNTSPIPTPTLNSERLAVIESNKCTQTIVNSVDEAKCVLNYLGADVDTYMEVNNIDTLLRMICTYENDIIGPIYNKKGDLSKVKEIFNQTADIKIRKRQLHEYAKSIKTKKGI